MAHLQMIYPSKIADLVTKQYPPIFYHYQYLFDITILSPFSHHFLPSLFVDYLTIIPITSPLFPLFRPSVSTVETRSTFDALRVLRSGERGGRAGSSASVSGACGCNNNMNSEDDINIV